jgi:hypothetical protein
MRRLMMLLGMVVLLALMASGVGQCLEICGFGFSSASRASIVR